jgi:zinc transport system permease protein
MLNAIQNYQFMQNALIACVFSSVVCGIIGVIIIEKKLVMMSGGIAHISFGGVGLGYLLGFEPVIGAFVFSVLSALGIGFTKRRQAVRSDVIIGLLWSFGMACGIFFIGMKKGYALDISSYLFGNILSVTKTDIRLIIVLGAVVIAVIAAFFAYWKSFLFDEEYAGASGVNTALFDYLLLILVALSVVILIRVAGIILLLSLLTAPAATASLFTARLKTRIIFSILLGVLYSVTGLWISYNYNIASGATIVTVSVIAFFSVFAAVSVIKSKKRVSKEAQA